MNFLHLYRLVGCNFLLIFSIFITVSVNLYLSKDVASIQNQSNSTENYELHTSDFITYHPSIIKSKGDDLHKKCKANWLNEVARINDSVSLKKARSTITDDKDYWTGLSWENGAFYWEKDHNNGAHVNDSIVTLPAGRDWHCFTVAANKSTLEPKRCSERLFYICEQKPYTVTYHPSTEKCKGDEISKQCKAERQNGVARINDSMSLNKVKNAIKDNNDYWTGLSWENGAFYWEQDHNKGAHVNDSIVTLPARRDWHCFTVAANKSTLEPKRCNLHFLYICDQYDPIIDVSTSSVLVLMATTRVSTQPDTTIGTEPTPTTALKTITNEVSKSARPLTTFSTSNKEAATSTERSLALITPALTSTLTANKSLTTGSIIITARVNTETSTVTSSITDATDQITSAQEQTAFSTSKTEAPSSTERRLRLITPTLTSTLAAKKSLTTGSILITARVNTETSTVTSSIKDATDQRTSTLEKRTFSTSKTEAPTPTERSSELITLTLTSTLMSNKVLTTDSIPVTARVNTSAITVTPSITDGSNQSTSTRENLTANEKLLQYFLAMRALDVTKKDSLQDAVNTTSNFFRGIKEDRPKKSDINILAATQELESFAIKYGKIHYKANESKIFSQEQFAMKIQKISANHKEAVTFSVKETDYSTGEGSASISLPSEIFKEQDAVVVSILYNDIKQWIPDERQVLLDGKTLTEVELRSRIMASTADPRPSHILQENVTISFSYNDEEDVISHCVFWDFTIKSKLKGSWSSKGCSLVKKVNKEITCTCNHLTNFAVLMQVEDAKVPSDHKVALEVVTYVGCALSLVGEVLTITAYYGFMNLKQEQIQIRFNLVTAIAIAQITFITGIDASESKGICVFVAAVIHYFYLVGFAWMLFEGVYLYLLVVKVFNTVIRMRLFYVVAWGLPLLIVMLSIVIASIQDGGVHSYVHGNFCWVSFTNKLIWTFVTPVLVVCLINSIILGRVVYEIHKMHSNNNCEQETVRQGVKACVVLFPLLGMTWVFGVLSVADAGLALQYIFTILNSLQGLFIFILHVLRNGEVREAYSRKMKTWKEARSVGNSHVTNHNSIDMCPITVTNEKEDSRTRRNSDTPRVSVGCGSTIALHQERSMTPIDT